MAVRFEHRIEATAEHLDKGMTRPYNDSQLFRLAAGGISTAADIGLLIGAKRLAVGGHDGSGVLN